MTQIKAWLDYYNVKAKSSSKSISWVSGYHRKLATISKETHAQWYIMIRNKLKLNKKHLLLDVGCGAGFMTIPLLRYVDTIIGLDALQAMLYRIPRKHRRIIKILSMADEMPLPDDYVDRVLCNSIFQYFSSYEYAKKVLKEMYRVCKPGGYIFVVDLPDKVKVKAYSTELKKESFKHKNLKRILYEKRFFLKLFPKAKIFDQSIKGYGNSPFRFNVLIRKK